MGKKIYVGNISFKATAEGIRELFSKIGAVASATIITDGQTGRSKGFGFVEMGSEEDAEKAITALNGTTFLERTLSVAEAKPARTERRSNEGKWEGSGGFEERRGGFGGGRGPGRGRR